MVLAHDIDSDGIGDVVVKLYEDDEFRAYSGRRNGVLESLELPIEAALSSFVGSGDLNGDSVEDLVFSDAHGIGVLLGLGGGAFRPAKWVSDLLPQSRLILDDFNDDGVLDLISTFRDEWRSCVFLGSGDGDLLTPKCDASFLVSGEV
jgi:hypothetical protein